MSESEELLRLIDAHIEGMAKQGEIFDNFDDSYDEGMRAIRWIVYNFFNAPRPNSSAN